MAQLALKGGPKVLPQGIAVRWPMFDAEDEASLLQVFRSGSWWRGGTIPSQAESVCGAVEREFGELHDSTRALALMNGTVAVELALRAAGVKTGDEVVVPALSFIVTASAPLLMGAVPVFADCDPRTLQMDPASAEAAITSRTRAICLVHFGGYPADLDKLTELAKRRGVALIEDSAHAHGTQWRGKGVGSWGDFGTFSFQQFKSLPCGEGGMLLARDQEGWDAAYSFHNLGRQERTGFYDFHTMASNFRITDLQGALLRSQLKKLKAHLPIRMAAAERLGRMLGDIGGLAPLPADPRITRRGYYYFVMQYSPDAFGGASRDTFLEALRAEGVSLAGKGYGGSLHRNPLFQDRGARYRDTSCPAADRATASLVTLHHPALLADADTIKGIADAVAKIRRNAHELR
jgi:dTDP-4-amino-4,6-dideoxygalactose transaminase